MCLPVLSWSSDVACCKHASNACGESVHQLALRFSSAAAWLVEREVLRWIFFLYTDLGVRVLSVDPQEIDGHIDIRHERTCVIRHLASSIQGGNKVRNEPDTSQCSSNVRVLHSCVVDVRSEEQCRRSVHWIDERVHSTTFAIRSEIRTCFVVKSCEIDPCMCCKQTNKL